MARIVMLIDDEGEAGVRNLRDRIGAKFTVVGTDNMDPVTVVDEVANVQPDIVLIDLFDERDGACKEAGPLIAQALRSKWTKRALPLAVYTREGLQPAVVGVRTLRSGADAWIWKEDPPAKAIEILDEVYRQAKSLRTLVWAAQKNGSRPVAAAAIAVFIEIVAGVVLQLAFSPGTPSSSLAQQVWLVASGAVFVGLVIAAGILRARGRAE